MSGSGLRLRRLHVNSGSCAGLECRKNNVSDRDETAGSGVRNFVNGGPNRDLALLFAPSCSFLPLSHDRGGRSGAEACRGSTATHGPPRSHPARSTRHLCAAAFALAAAWPAAAQTSVKFSLDGRARRAGGAVPASAGQGLLQGRGARRHHRRGGESRSSRSPASPSGGYDMGFADINALIRYRDQHPSAPVKAVFMVYNKPPYAIVARKSRGITEPKQLEGKKLGAPPAGVHLRPMAAVRQAQQHRHVESHDREHRHAGARADARRRPARRRARLLRSGSTSISRTAACRSTTSC